MRILKVLFVTALIFSWATPIVAAPALDRVNKTGKINCGYVEYNPALMKDATTGIWSGFNYDILQAVGNRLELEVNFTTPTGWATVVPDLNTNKFDMFCSGFWVHPNVGKFALFSRPAFFQPVFVIARANDKRFTKLPNLNDNSLTMSALEGDNPVAIAAADFPKARVLTLPNLTDFSQVLTEVATSKADFTIVDGYTFGAFNKANPGKLKIVDVQKPIRIYPVSYVFKADDFLFRDAFNAALDELILDGTIDRIFDKYEDYPNAYYRAVVPYKNIYKP